MTDYRRRGLGRDLPKRVSDDRFQTTTTTKRGERAMTPERPRHRREAFPSTAGERELREVVKQLEHAQRLEARLTLRRNRLFAKAIEGGRSVTEAAAACGVSRLTAYRILDRVKANTPPPRLTAASNGHEMVADEATV